MSKPRGPYARGVDVTLLGSGIKVRRATGALPGMGVVSEGTKSQKIAPEAAEGPRITSQTLILDGFPTPGQVRMLGPNSGTSHRYGLSTLRARVQARVQVEVMLQHIHPVSPPVRVTLRYVFADNRHRDDGNFSLVAKPVIDGLVRSGILAGDNHARLTERVEFVKEPGARRLEIVLAHGEPGDGERS